MSRAASADAALPAKRLNDRQRELLALMSVDGNVARYTGGSHISDWAALKKVMLALGSKWVRKLEGFAFDDDADGVELVRVALATGEVLDSAAAGFFPTPTALADRLVSLAGIDLLSEGSIVLEPSAGRGAIAHAIRRANPLVRIVCYELLPDNRKALEQDGFAVHGDDFLAAGSVVPAAVVMNPPFAKRADVHHIRHALRLLRPCGMLAAIASAGIRYRTDALGAAFRRELDDHGAFVEDNPDGSFAESGTMVRTVTISLRKKNR